MSNAKNAMPHDLDEPLVDCRELARLLGLSVRTVESIKFTESLGVPRIKVGGCVRFRPSDIRSALIANEGKLAGKL
jgi:hypothetical protein